ncbi:MAG: ATP-dependent helicase RhlE [Phycisphaerales bacterium]|jgi:ATP-dependent RNA helicase RhlE|nr:ATP-dependent helicase RhlE [Phycisphaerales bacterium]
MQFSSLGLIEPILRALATEQYFTATPIQAQAIPPGLEGRDVLGCAQTGTGKTAAFALPILQRLSAVKATSHRARCLVLAPTRELATQIAQGFGAYGKNLQIKTTVIFGGVGENPQISALRRGIDVIIATPGRLLDLMNQGHVDFKAIEVLVLDEADRMLDMGFIRDIRKIIAKLPAKKQTMLFSATMPPEIRELANSLLHHPAVVQVAPAATTVEKVEQSVYFVEKPNKPQLLAHLVNDLPMSRAIVFTRTKHGADKVVRHLHQRGIKAEAIHGNKSQNARERALANFRASKIPVLVATDIASRGIDIDNVSHVVNYDLTHEPETYVHRIGRTARAGLGGEAISFCDREERGNLRAIEKLIKHTIEVKDNHPAYEAPAPRAVDHDRPAHAPSQSRQHPPMGRRDQQQKQRAREEQPHTPSSSGGNGHPQRNGQPRPQHAPRANAAATPAASHGARPNRPGGGVKPHYAGKVKAGRRRRGF